MANLNNKTSVAKLPTSDAAPPYDELNDASFHIHIKSNLYSASTKDFINISKQEGKHKLSCVIRQKFIDNIVIFARANYRNPTL